ncbi:hypothetical protein LR69_02092 [Geobacillus sp. BCO2]|nr:hypothetical protein LR69_02092 [Geobacillus sp. BCO2]
MQAAAQVEGMLSRSGKNGIDGGEGVADQKSARFVHVRENRRILGAKAVVVRRRFRQFAAPGCFHRLDVRAVVNERELVVRCHAWGDDVPVIEGAERAKQVVCHFDPQLVERMVVMKFVLKKLLAVNKYALFAHDVTPGKFGHSTR